MLAVGEADALVTGVTRSYTATYDDVRRVIDAQPGKRVFGLSMVLARGRTVFVADTTVHELPSSVEMADIAVQTAEVARRLGHEPRVAMLSYSNFGNPGSGPKIKAGMCFAIEPMINMGLPEVYTKQDGWTICTKDGLPSAHFEHTITITESGAKILTL